MGIVGSVTNAFRGASKNFSQPLLYSNRLKTNLRHTSAANCPFFETMFLSLTIDIVHHTKPLSLIIFALCHSWVGYLCPTLRQNALSVGASELCISFLCHRASWQRAVLSVKQPKVSARPGKLLSSWSPCSWLIFTKYRFLSQVGQLQCYHHVDQSQNKNSLFTCELNPARK